MGADSFFIHQHTDKNKIPQKCKLNIEEGMKIQPNWSTNTNEKSNIFVTGLNQEKQCSSWGWSLHLKDLFPTFSFKLKNESITSIEYSSTFLTYSVSSHSSKSSLILSKKAWPNLSTFTCGNPSTKTNVKVVYNYYCNSNIIFTCNNI